MNLHEVFESVAIKRLIDVDLPNRNSNQHEVNGTIALRQFFNTPSTINGIIHWYLFVDDLDTIERSERFTFYDARVADRNRTEWRLYYRSDFLSLANPGDVLILVKKVDGAILGLVFQQDSAWLRAAISLFGFVEINNEFRIFDEQLLNRRPFDIGERLILDELGIDYEVVASPQIEEIAHREFERSNRGFPSTRKLAELAWENCQVNLGDPDSSLLTWLGCETEIFFSIERIIVQPRLAQGFQSVDEFITYSLEVLNTRKSRMGRSLENHLEKLFVENDLKFSSQARTEGTNKPDFLFPGYNEYHDEEFDARLLIMLAAKSSCKERWKQVLNEADRIPCKHLCTLDRSISNEQMNGMREASIRLVIPAPYHVIYPEHYQQGLWTIQMFIEFVREIQSLG